MKYSTTMSGILVMVIGTVLVQNVGLTENCSSEITTKLVEYIPLVVGGVMSWIGRIKAGGVSLGGFKV